MTKERRQSKLHVLLSVVRFDTRLRIVNAIHMIPNAILKIG